MNFPTTTNHETNTSKHHDWPESDIWSEHSYGYTQSSTFRPFGNRAASQSGVLMVEDPVNERERTRESSPDSKQLVEIVKELRKSNEELKATNQLFSQKLEQTNQLVQQGFKSIRDAISNIPGQINQNINNSIVNSPSNEKANCWPMTGHWTRTSESSSIISSLPEDLADEIEELHFNPVTLPESTNYAQSLIPIKSTVTTSSSTISDNRREEMKKISQAMKEKFGLEYDDKSDFDVWLRK